jgi:hypothetical protein
MKAYDMSMVEIQRYGFEILTQNLGVVGMLKFTQQFDKGHGDYTKERSKWLNNSSIDDIESEIMQIKKNKSRTNRSS